MSTCHGFGDIDELEKNDIYLHTTDQTIDVVCEQDYFCTVI